MQESRAGRSVETFDALDPPRPATGAGTRVQILHDRLGSEVQELRVNRNWN
jgi:hypothetical protein